MVGVYKCILLQKNIRVKYHPNIYYRAIFLNILMSLQLDISLFLTENLNLSNFFENIKISFELFQKYVYNDIEYV